MNENNTKVNNTNVEGTNLEQTQPVLNIVQPTNIENTQPVLNTVQPTNIENTQPVNTVQTNSVTNTPVANIQSNNDTISEQSSTDSSNSNVPNINPNLKPTLNNNSNNSDDGYVNEKLKEVEINYTPPSKFKIFSTIFIFALVLGFIVFLPEIDSFLDSIKEKKEANETKEILSGKAICTLETNTENLDKDFERIFNFDNRIVNSARFTTTIRGDVALDSKTLDELSGRCTLLKDEVSKIDGIEVSCEVTESSVVQNESFDLEQYDYKKISSAYAEAGLDLIELSKEENIDDVLKLMKNGGFKCYKEE